MHGNWTLLIQSSTKIWYWDVDTLFEDNSGVISFWSYWTQVLSSGDLNENSLFESKSYGPYIQKIDLTTFSHSSESIVDGRCDLSDASEDVQNNDRSDSIECWRKIKPKTAIAFMMTRVCGRRFTLETQKNYFLFQSDNATPSSNGFIGERSSKNILIEPSQGVKFFEVVDNQYLLIDPKKNIREMRIASFYLDKSLSQGEEYVYRASCEEEINSLTLAGKPSVKMEKIGEYNSLSRVAFNRFCSDHGKYVSLVKVYSK